MNNACDSSSTPKLIRSLHLTGDVAKSCHRCIGVLAMLVCAACAHAAGLPDTGQTTCYDGSAMVACSKANAGDAAAYPRQDGRFGRDPEAAAGKAAKIGGGAAGFDYTKIANNGSILAATTALGSAAGDWACTRDNITGLVWEVKANAGLRSQSDTYSWYSSNASTNAGNAGVVSGGNCQSAGRCDTEKFAADVNAVALCGYSDWRMPSLRELLTLVHAGAGSPSIEISYFPNTPASNFWAATSFVGDTAKAWNIDFYDGGTYTSSRGGSGYVRLVFGAPF